MKINTLLEYTSPSSQPNQAGGQAPEFGRDPNVLETTIGLGSVATVNNPVGGMQRRNSKGSMFQGIKTSKKFVNSPVTEDEISEEQLLTKLLRKELFNKAKDHGIGNRPKDYGIMAKESDPEYDDEAGMTTTNLHTALRAVEGLNKVIGPNENLPEWVQEKIAIANDYLVTCWDYMISQHEQGRKYEVDENQDWMKDIAAMAHKMAPQDKMRQRQAERQAQEKIEQQQRIQKDVENLPDLISQYRDMKSEYESMGGSNWQYADREQNLSDKERKARGMETSMRHLANRIHAAKKASEGLEEAKPDFAKMFNNKIDKFNKVVVQTKKEIGSRIADIGPGGKEYNVKTDKEWDKQKGVTEVAPPGAKAERMVKHIKKSYAKDGKITPKEKSIAYATAWKAHNKGSVEEGVAEGSLKEFAPVGSNDGNDGFSDDTLKLLAAQWYNGDEDPKVERTLLAAGWEIGQDEGYDDEPGVFVVQAGDINGNSYMSWPADELRQGVAEGWMSDDEPVSWEKGGTRAPTGAFRNPAVKKVVFNGTGDDGGKYEVIQSGPDDYMIHVNGKHIDTYSSLQRAMSILKNEVSGLKKSVDEACWKGYHKEGMKTMFGKRYPNCVKNKNESLETYIHKGECPGCGGQMVAEGQLNEKQDACYHKVKSRYKVWPSAYASGALVQCRKKGAANWGNSNESITQEEYDQLDENLKKWFSDKWVRFGPDGKIRGDCARGDDSEGKPKCLPQSKAHSLGKKGRATAASRKRREDPNPERSGKAINVNTKKKSNEGI